MALKKLDRRFSACSSFESVEFCLEPGRQVASIHDMFLVNVGTRWLDTYDDDDDGENICFSAVTASWIDGAGGDQGMKDVLQPGFIWWRRR